MKFNVALSNTEKIDTFIHHFDLSQGRHTNLQRRGGGGGKP